MTDATFDEDLDSAGGNMLVLFKAEQCGHCKRMAPDYERLSEDDDVRASGVTVAAIDVPRNRQSTVRFGVRGFPTLMHLRDGKFYRYRGPRAFRILKEWVTGGYRDQGGGEDIPEKPSSFSQTVMIGKAAWLELKDAAMGKSGMAGYLMVLLMGVLVMILGFTVWFFVVLLIWGVNSPETEEKDKKS